MTAVDPLESLDMCLTYAYDAARIARTVVLWCILASSFGSSSTHAAESRKEVVFYPPFDVAEIANRVQKRQHTLGVAQFHSMIVVQFGTRIEWTNACAWLDAQTERVMRAYQPPQNGTDEYYFFCSVYRTYSEVSEDTLSDLYMLINEFTDQFGGATKSWAFNFRQYSEHENGAE